jgi:hypothetical protein
MTWTDKGIENPTHKVLKIAISCGETTCTSAKGSCRFMLQQGQNPTICVLFPSAFDSFTTLEANAEGQILRCASCKRAS